MSKSDLAILWVMSGLASLAAIGAKLGMLLYSIGGDPPVDQTAFIHWQRRRRWLTYSELTAVPCFATTGVAATVYWHLPPVASVMISMMLGALGFGFLLHALETLARRRAGIEP